MVRHTILIMNSCVQVTNMFASIISEDDNFTVGENFSVVNFHRVIISPSILLYPLSSQPSYFSQHQIFLKFSSFPLYPGACTFNPCVYSLSIKRPQMFECGKSVVLHMESLAFFHFVQPQGTPCFSHNNQDIHLFFRFSSTIGQSLF